MRIVPVDALVNGKGSRFAKVKTVYDSPDPAPMALLSIGTNGRFLAGTDLGHTKALITVGAIPDKMLVQALGRVFRPVPGRDPTQPIHMFKIYTH